MLHVADMARNRLKKVGLSTNDTAVLVINVAFFHKVQAFWLAFGTGRNFRYIPVHTIARHLGQEKCKAILGFHALTVCDSVSAFF